MLFESLTLTNILAGVMTMVGDILVIMVLIGAGASLLGVLLRTSHRNVAGSLSGSILGIVVISAGMAAKFYSSQWGGTANGFAFGFSDGGMIAILFGSQLLAIGALALIVLRRRSAVKVTA